MDVFEVQRKVIPFSNNALAKSKRIQKDFVTND